MTTQAQDDVRAHRDRRRRADRARVPVFTEQFDRIKPREHNMLGVDIAESVFEPRVGGSIYDRGVDGSECRWARVLAYEPPERIVFSWDIGPTWQIETDPDRTSEVEVRFVADARADAGRARAPPHRPPRRRLGGRARGRRRRTRAGRCTCSATAISSRAEVMARGRRGHPRRPRQRGHGGAGPGSRPARYRAARARPRRGPSRRSSSRLSETVQSSAILPFSKRLMVMPGSVTRAALVGAVQRPARGDAIAVGGLILDLDAQVGEDGAVERDRLGDALLAVEVECVDVVDEVLRVELAGARQVAASADLLQRVARVVSRGAHRALGRRRRRCRWWRPRPRSWTGCFTGGRAPRGSAPRGRRRRRTR